MLQSFQIVRIIILELILKIKNSQGLHQRILFPPLNLKTKILQIYNSSVYADCNIYPGKDYKITQRSNTIESHRKDPLQKKRDSQGNPKK